MTKNQLSSSKEVEWLKKGVLRLRSDISQMNEKTSKDTHFQDVKLRSFIFEGEVDHIVVL